LDDSKPETVESDYFSIGDLVDVLDARNDYGYFSGKIVNIVKLTADKLAVEPDNPLKDGLDYWIKFDGDLEE
jgi:hypothetical protein